MTFDFDHVPQRLGTDSQKWQKYAGRDILPLWVADMDFKASPAIVAALHDATGVWFDEIPLMPYKVVAKLREFGIGG